MKANFFKIISKLKFVIPIIYLFGAIFVFWDFCRTSQDGFANLGLIIYTLPIFLFGNFVFEAKFPFFPGNYYLSHTFYFILSTLLIAFLTYYLIFLLEKIIKSKF